MIITMREIILNNEALKKCKRNMNVTFRTGMEFLIRRSKSRSDSFYTLVCLWSDACMILLIIRINKC